MTTHTLAVLMAPINDNTNRWFISVTSIDGPSCMTFAPTFFDAFATANQMWRDLVNLHEPRPDQIELWTFLGTEPVINFYDAFEPAALFAHLNNIPDHAINVSRRVIAWHKEPRQ